MFRKIVSQKCLLRFQTSKNTVITVLKSDATSAFYLMWLSSYLLFALLFLTQPIRESSGLGDQGISNEKYCIRKLQNGVYLFTFMARQPPAGLSLLSVEVSRSHSETPQLGRTPLDEWSALRRNLYLTSHNTDKRQTSMPPARFEPAMPASELPPA